MCKHGVSCKHGGEGIGGGGDGGGESKALVCGSTEQRSTRASIEEDALGQLHVMQGCTMPESPKESVVLLGCCCCVEAERVLALISWRGLLCACAVFNLVPLAPILWRGLLCACAVFNFVPPVANEAGCNGAGTRRNALSKRALMAVGVES